MLRKHFFLPPAGCGSAFPANIVILQEVEVSWQRSDEYAGWGKTSELNSFNFFFLIGREENFMSVEYILYMITGKSMERKTENTFVLCVIYIIQF